MAVTHHPLPAERAVFWYGCNLLRHGDILRLTSRFLEAVGVDATPRKVLSVILCARSVLFTIPRTFRSIGWRTGSWPHTTRAAVAFIPLPLG